MSDTRSGHLGLDRLADLEEDLLAAEDTQRAQQHLAGCPECQTRRDRLAQVRAALADLPADPVPADVAARLDAAVATAMESADATPATTVVPLAPRRRGWRAHPTALGLGTAAAVAAVVVAVTVGQGSSHPGSSSSTLAQRGANATTPELADLAKTATGTDYTPGNLAAAVPSLLGPQQAAPKAAPAPQTAAGATSRPAGAAAAIGVPAALDRLYRSPKALADCVAGVEAGSSGLTRPLAIDFARYRGAPAVLVVLPGLTPGNLDAWFVGPGCSSHDANLLHYEAVPESSGSPSG